MNNYDMKNANIEEMKAVDINVVDHFYSNNVMVNSGIYDFNFLFNQTLPDYNGEGIVISMSPQHAKALNTILTTALESYEQQYGMIPKINQ